MINFFIRLIFFYFDPHLHSKQRPFSLQIYCVEISLTTVYLSLNEVRDETWRAAVHY